VVAESSTGQRTLTIAFASETGTAEAVAKNVFDEVLASL
jgi:sulfite reductase alpha subunit-like flavoprotein